jgi:hypothetical protein
VSGGGRSTRGINSLAPLGYHLIGIIKVVKIVHFLRYAIISDTVFFNFVSLFEILMAHNVIVASEGLDDVGLAVVVDYDRLRKVAARTSGHTRWNFSNFVRIVVLVGVDCPFAGSLKEERRTLFI